MRSMTMWALSLVILLLASAACEFGIGDNRTPTPIPPVASDARPPEAAFAAGAPTAIPAAVPTAIPAANPTVIPTAIPTPIPLPIGSFSADSVTGSAPLSVQFRGLSDGIVTSWKWDFGDGNTSTDKSPTHLYTIAGSYTVGLEVSGPGGTDTSILVDLITIEPGPLAALEVQPSYIVMEEGIIQPFSAAGFDLVGNEIPDLDILWEATGGDITKGGLFTARSRSGYYEVSATASFRGSTQRATAGVPIPPTWAPVGDMLAARDQHTATALPNGKVLIVGRTMDTAELYDPATRTFDATGSPVCYHGLSPAATLMANDTVLITGGESDPRCAEIYNPDTEMFSRVGDLNADHWQHASTLLDDGKVLITGGFEIRGGTEMVHSESEIYDPVSQSFTVTGSLNLARTEHNATPLPSGKVLVPGGVKGLTATGPRPSVCLSSPEIYDPASGRFRALDGSSHATCHMAATLLEDGKVLLTSNDQSTEIFDPESETFRATGSLVADREGFAATLLRAGEVLYTGGYFPIRSPRPKNPVLKEIVNWDFTVSNWGWHGSSSVKNFISTEQGIEFDSEGDGWITSPPLDYPEGEDLRVTIRMKTTAGWNTQIFYGLFHRESMKTTFNINSDGEWRDYVVVIPPLRNGSTIRIDTPWRGAGHTTIAWVNIQSQRPMVTSSLDSTFEPVVFWDLTAWTQGFFANPSAYNVRTTTDGLEFEEEGGAWVTSPPLNYPEGESLRVTFRMKNSGGSSGTMFYGRFETAFTDFSIRSDGQWHDYEIFIPPQEDGSHIRIDPPNVPGETAIAWVSIDSLVPTSPPSALATSEVFDPLTRTFKVTNSMTGARYRHTATRLANGQILVTGGASPTGFPIVSPTGEVIGERFEDTPLSSAELWIPIYPSPSAPPSASFSVDVGSGVAPLAVKFDNTSEGPLASVEWDFGDGITSNEYSPTHLFTAAGTHSVKLTVSGPGGTETTVLPDLVTVEPGPLANVLIEPAEVTLDIGVTQPFRFTAFDEFGNDVFGVIGAWNVTPDVGTIDADGVFTAGKTAGKFPGAVQLDVIDGTDRASAKADVNITPDPLASIEVQPSRAMVIKGTDQQFTATGFDEHGNEIHGLAYVWKATGGKITKDGLLLSIQEIGTYEVEAIGRFRDRDRIGAATVEIILPGLVSRWSGEGNANDTIGDNHGVLRRGATYAAGIVGQGFKLNGIDGVVEIPDNENLNILGDVTVSLWAKQGEVLFTGGGQYLIAKIARGSGDVATAYEIWISPKGEIAATFELADGANLNVGGNVITDSDFHHYVYVRSNSPQKIHKVFIDGVLAGENSFIGSPGDTSGGLLTIGGPIVFGGVIDEVEIYSRALSNEEIKDIYRAVSSP